jgi:hypothetical protein
MSIPEKAEEVRSNMKSLRIVSSTLNELHIMNLFRKDKPEASIAILTPYGVCGKVFGEIDMKNGIRLTGYSTITTRLLTLFCLCMIFCLKTTHLSFKSPIITRFSVMCLTSLPKTEDDIKRKEISDVTMISSKIMGHTCQVSKN